MYPLIDGDSFRYRDGWAAEYTYYHVHRNGDDEESIEYFSSRKDAEGWIKESNDPSLFYIREEEFIEELDMPLRSITQTINQINQRCNAKEYQIFLSGDTNFRDEIGTIKKYKGNRQNKRPAYYDDITSFLVDKHGAIIVEGMEADDAMSMEQFHDWEYVPWGVPNTVICTVDKDLNMIPGWHYNFNKDILYDVSEEDAILWFYCQLIMGDPVDNIQGIWRAGKKKAYNLLKDCDGEKELYEAAEAAYVEAYEDEAIGKAAMVENSRLLWMLRHQEDIIRGPFYERQTKK